MLVPRPVGGGPILEGRDCWTTPMNGALSGRSLKGGSLTFSAFCLTYSCSQPRLHPQ